MLALLLLLQMFTFIFSKYVIIPNTTTMLTLTQCICTDHFCVVYPLRNSSLG